MSKLAFATARNLWIGAMVVASIVTTLAFACATPFPALAAIAALHVRRGGGVVLMALAWLASQITGFGLLHYPVTGENIGWAFVLGAGAITGLIAADRAARIVPGGYVGRLVSGYVAAFVVFKATVLLGTIALGSGWAAFAPDILARQFVRYALILVVLAVLHRVLALAGVRDETRAVYA